MAEIVRYYDPDATGLNNGLDWANAYTTLAAWETTEGAASLPTDWHHLYVRNSLGTITSELLGVDGWDIEYILIEAADGYQAVVTEWDIGRFQWIVSEAAQIIRVRRSIDFRVKGLQVRNTATGLCINANDAETPNIDVDSCRMQNPNGGSTLQSLYGTMDCKNSIFEGSNAGSGNGIFYRATSSGGSVYNCISVGYGDGIESDGPAVVAKNCAVFNNTEDMDNISTIENCASDDGLGTNPVVPTNWADEFLDWVNGDFSILETSQLRGAGLGPSADVSVPTSDMAGNLRSGATSDIGVIEFQSSDVVSLSGIVDAAGDISGSLTLTENVSISGTISAEGEISGSLSLLTDVALSGVVDAEADISGVLTIDEDVALAGIVDGIADISGALTVAGEIELSGVVDGIGDISGSLTVVEGEPVILSGVIDANGDITGSLRVATGEQYDQFRLNGKVSTSFALNGKVTNKYRLSGRIDGR